MKLLAIDGNSIANRAFYGVRSLTNSLGQPTNAIYGFLNILLKLVSEINPEFVAVAFDVKAPTFRSKQYDKYKANRTPTPSELLSQLIKIKEILKLMGYTVIEKPGFEADDILGTLGNLTQTNKDLEYIIVTGDKDIFQLIKKNITVKMMSTKSGAPVTTDYNVDDIIKKYNIKPEQLIDVKALMGDRSDNIPGVLGVGEKTALSLINKYNNLETIYNNLETLEEKVSLKNKLLASREMAFLSKDLATICTCVPIDLELKTYKISAPDNKKLFEILSELEIFSIIKRLGLSDKYPKQELSKSSIISQVSFDNINNIKKSLENSKNKKIYILLEENNIIIMIDDNVFFDLDKIKIFEILINFFDKDNNFEIYTNKAKQVYIDILNNFKNNNFNIIFDSEIAGYLLNPDFPSYEFDKLINLFCKTSLPDRPEDKIILFKNLCDIMKSQINQNNLSFLFNQVEMPLCSILAEMEVTGVKIDQRGLILFGEELSENIEKLQNQIYLLAGCEFNINSPKQLSKILFEDLKLFSSKKTKTGYSTNADVLVALKDQHPIIDKILDYRSLIKLKNTYIDGLLKEVKSDDRVHSCFNQTETKTGRISSERPNLQSIPVRTQVGSKLRSYFVAQENYKLIDSDYSQVELRILAELSNDQNLINAFKNNQDIHSITASEVFGVELKDVSPQMRSFAKSINFGIIYGISGFALSKEIGVSVSESKKYMDSYFEKFDQVKEYLTKTIESATEKNFVTTLFGRKRYIPELLSSNKNIKAAGERIARNTPVQGTAADIIKIAMVRVYNKLKQKNLKSKIILQIHDELLIESPLDEVDEVKEILKNEMQQAANLKVQLKVDIGVGSNWLECH